MSKLMWLKTFRDSVLFEISCFASGPKHQNILRTQLENYVKHGGEVFATKYSVLYTTIVGHRACRIDWIPDFLFKSSEAWLVDDLSSLDICLIGTMAHADAMFRDWIKKEVASYRSPALLGQIPFANNLFETTFGKASIEGHFRTLGRHEISKFLSLCCRTGPVSMMKFFIDIGVDVDGGDWHEYLLGHAAAVGNMEIVRMLLEAGANSSFALREFLNYSDHLSDARFKRHLKMLVENARPASFTIIQDPLLAIIKSERALHFHPKAREILLNRKIFAKEGFGRGANQDHIEWSYMYQAIRRKDTSLVELLIHNGAHANTHISQFLRSPRFETCTWITFSVMLGAASCADVLIQHGADVIAPD